MDELSKEIAAERQKRALEVAQKRPSEVGENDRRYYGAPQYRGRLYEYGSSGGIICSCVGRSLVCHPSQIQDGAESSYLLSIYREQVQEYLFRKFVGYPIEVWRMPTKPEAIEVYNEVCHEMGFPEEVIQVPEEHTDMEGGMTDAKTFTSPVVPPEDKTM